MVLSATVYASPFFLILSIPGLILGIISIVDVFLHPTWAWESSGQNRTLWIVLTIVGLFICPLIIGLVYLIAIRPKVAAAQRAGGPTGGGGYGATGQYGAGPGQYGATGQYGAGPGQYGAGPGQYGAPPGQYGGASGQYGGSTSPGSGQYGGTPTPPPYGGTSTPPPPGPTPASPPPGWYPDPAGSGQPRYWNGQSWA